MHLHVCVYFPILMIKVPNGFFFDVIAIFIIQKLKSKHTSLSFYIFLSFWGNERRQKQNIPHPSVTCSRDSSKNQSESEKVLTIGLLLPKEVSDQDEMSYYNR